MMKEKMEAIRRYINQRMREIPTDIIDKMMSDGIGGFENITPYEDDDERPYSYNNNLPMWGKMWGLCKEDEDWLVGYPYTDVYRFNTNGHLKEVKDIGFTIYRSHFGVFLGIDNGGCNFYEKYWEPLYDLLLNK